MPDLGAYENVRGNYTRSPDYDREGIIAQPSAAHRHESRRIDEIELHKEFVWDHFLVDEEGRGDGEVVVESPRLWVGATPFRVDSKGYSEGRGQAVENIPP